LPDLKIRFLGTASAVPTKDRGLSCVLIQFENELLFFDCGEGAQRAAVIAGASFNRETSIFVTHMHGDHLVGLLGLMQTMALNRRDRDLRVFGPKGVIDFITINQRLLNFGLTYNVLGREIRRGVVYETERYRVLAERSEHSTLSFSYIFEEKDRPGRFNAKRALALGVPEGPLWSKLQHGKAVKSSSRKKVLPSQVLGAPRKGRRIGISGDTRPTKTLEKFFHGCNVLIFDSTYSDEHKQNAAENLHSTAREAATLAKKAKVKQLILTHFSARYRSVDELVKQARSVFRATIAASDQLVYDLSKEA
jgi:ribonuclease Z